jgi:hypothetical protein
MSDLFYEFKLGYKKHEVQANDRERHSESVIAA